MEFVVQGLQVLATSGDEQVVGHIHQQAQITGGVFAQGLLQSGGHQPGIPGGFQQMVQAFKLVGGRQRLGA